MKLKRVVPSQLAVSDFESAIGYLYREVGESAALAFANEVDKAYLHISRFPQSGSSRYAHELGLPELRSWPVARFPYLVFYVDREDRVDIRRVLHGRSDIPAWLMDTD